MDLGISRRGDGVWGRRQRRNPFVLLIHPVSALMPSPQLDREDDFIFAKSNLHFAIPTLPRPLYHAHATTPTLPRPRSHAHAPADAPLAHPRSRLHTLMISFGSTHLYGHARREEPQGRFHENRHSSPDSASRDMRLRISHLVGSPTFVKPAFDCVLLRFWVLEVSFWPF